MTVMACDTTRRVPWPSELGFTRITAHLRVAYADTPCDEDEEPDALAPQGDVILAWDAPWFRYRPSDGGPVQGWGAQSVVCQILPDGTIAPPESSVTSDGSVIVMPTVHELLEPSGSTITATFRMDGPGPKFQPISFQARPGATINILAEANMGKQPGVVVEPIVTETTAERAEAAALRAEQAAAGVEDISQQVEQVQTYATRAETAATSAETAATSAETAASSAEAASAEAATVTTDAAYIRDVIAQHGTLKGDPGPAPSIEWQGDRLSVDGQLSPALTGAPGQDGGPVPAGGTAGQVITRTEDGGVAWTDANLYKSTRLTLHDAGGYKIKLRRVGDLVICSIHADKNTEALPVLSIPLGYQRADPVDLQRPMYRGGITHDNKHWGAVRFSGQTIIYNGALDTINAALVEVWDTDDPHPII